MKNFTKLIAIFLVSLALVGCSPKFKEGECIIDTLSCEKWEGNCHRYMSVILDVGRSHYHTIYTDTATFTSHSLWDERMDVMDYCYEKVKCPPILKEQYAKYKGN